MKLRQEGRARKNLRASEFLRHEQVEKVGFDPEQDISPEVRAALFRELDDFVREKMWLEYVTLFNRLELLFPNMDGRAKETISSEELLKIWELGKSRTGRPERDVTFNSIGSPSSVVVDQTNAAVEIKAFGLPIEGLFTRGVAFLRDLESKLALGVSAAPEDLITALRLGLIQKDTPLRGGPITWERLEPYFQGSQAEYSIAALASAKIFFPEREVSISEELLAEAKRSASTEVRRFGVNEAAKQFVNLQIATADGVQVGEKGELVVRKSNSKRLRTGTQLPERSI